MSGEASLLASGTLRVMDGTVHVTTYDRVSVDHVHQLLFRQAIRAKKARTVDTTDPMSPALRDHLVHAK